MVRGTDVRPQKWSDVIDLFDNGSYSAIWGRYDENEEERCLGVRWNGNDTDERYGYPSQGGHPVWYVEPGFLQRAILLALQSELDVNRSFSRRAEYQRNISTALAECP